MSHQKHIFRAQTAPTHKELHCLWATLTNKRFENKNLIDFKVVANGRLVQVICAEPITPQNVSLASNVFTYLRSEQVGATNYVEGQMVSVQGELAYSVHSTKTGKDECPVDAFGRLKTHLRTTFLAYLTAQTGVDFEQAFDIEALEFSWENRSDPSSKVWLNDVIAFNATGSVVNAVVANSLATRAIGRRRSYGLGNAQISKAALVLPEELCEQETI